MELLRQPVKGIFFDLGWTLVYPPSGDWEFTEPAKKQIGRASCRERV